MLIVAILVYSHWLSLGLGHGLGHGQRGCMVLFRTFHTAPEQGQGPEQGQERMDYVLIFQVLVVVCFNCMSMAFRFPVLVPGTANVNGFWTILILVPVPVPVTNTASVITP